MIQQDPTTITQPVEQIATNVAAATQTDVGLSLIDLAFKGGFLMIPLLILSIMSVWIFGERWWAIRKASVIDQNFMNQIRQYVHDGKIAAAVDLCRITPSPIARLIEKGLQRIGRPLTDVQAAVENVGNLEVARLEKGLPMLATVAGGGPMIGFLGTVTGMITAFFKMSQAGNNIEISLLSGGIYEALVTTVAGLIVGIMAFFGYNYLVSRIENLVYKMEANTIEFMDLLNEPIN